MRLAPDAGPDEVLEAAVLRAGLERGDVSDLDIVRRSSDRRRGRVVHCLTVELGLLDGPRHWTEGPDVRVVAPVEEERTPEPASRFRHRPVVVGSGPAGLFAALHLARAGHRPIVLERGDPMNLRARAIGALNREAVLDPESNYLFGEGGAGTFSDGKLTCRTKDRRVHAVLAEFRDKSGVAAVTRDSRPHLGSDRIRAVVGRLRGEILRLGGEIRYRTRLLRLQRGPHSTWVLHTGTGELATESVILAAGHSARDLTAALLEAGLVADARAFQLGFRVEHPQEWVDARARAQGDRLEGAADYRVLCRVGDASVFSFCMCPGGEIIAAVSTVEHMNTNGMSWSGRSSGLATSGIVTTVAPEALLGDDPFRGVALQVAIEAEAAQRCGTSVRVPAQRLVDFLAKRRSESLPAHSCKTGLAAADLRGLFPRPIEAVLADGLAGMERQMPGFLQPDALIVGPECRSSSPVRWRRDPTSLEADGAPGVLPVGEGAGYAGGIVSAAVDGVRAAESVCARFAPCP